MTKQNTFTPVRAMVLLPVKSDGKERARVFAHGNAALVWEKNFKN